MPSKPLLFAALLVLPITVEAAPADACFYAGGKAETSFQCVTALSDGSVLVAGATENLDWIAPGVARQEMALAGAPNDKGTNKIGFILRLTADLQRQLAVAYFKVGAAEDIHRIHSTEVPGDKTGALIISGSNASAERKASGYFLARLDHNFLDGIPTKAVWARPIWAEGDLKELQPWDVSAEGKVYYGAGVPYSQDWAEVGRLAADGTDDTVENWRNHQGREAGGEEEEAQFSPLSSRPSFHAARSFIAMKFQGRGALRSWTAEDYRTVLPDGNGGTKQGRWPDDYYFSGPYNPSDPGASQAGPGYTGYKLGSPCPRIGAIAVDRRNGSFFIGYSVQSRLPDGGPDFEPAVVAMDASGALRWWSRLYRETKQNSTPDQYVDHLAIDYSSDALTVQARCHGNNVINYWKGNEIAAGPKASGFQNSFTGNNGNIHVCWLGKLGLSDGTLRHATYVAEFVDGMEGTGGPDADPGMDGWPSPNNGWPQLNSTFVKSLDVDSQGRVYIAAIGRRVITTANAFQKMPKKGEGVSTWSFFARVYSADLSHLIYSSILNGGWKPDHAGETTVELTSVAACADGLIAVGRSAVDAKTRLPLAPAMPTARTPGWGETQPTMQSGVAAKLTFGAP